MNKSVLALAALAVLAAPAGLRAQSHEFEGTVTLKMTVRSRTVETTTEVKGNLTRIEQGHGMSSIVDLDHHQFTTLMPAQRMYMVQPIPAAVGGGGQAAPAPDIIVQDTGETETILGYACRKFTAKIPRLGGATTAELWITDQLGTYLGLGVGPGGSPAPWALALRGQNPFKLKDIFVMRVISSTSGGANPLRIDVTAVQPGALDDALFVAPPDWKQYSLGALLGGAGHN